MKKETKEKIFWGIIIFGVVCYLGNYYFLIFFGHTLLKKFSAASAAMLVLWPMYLWIIVIPVVCFLLDSAEEDIQKGGNYEDN